MPCSLYRWLCVLSLLCAISLTGGRAGAAAQPLRIGAGEEDLFLPPVGYHRLRVLAPTALELYRVTTDAPADGAPAWDFVDAQGRLRLPEPAHFRVRAGNRTLRVEAVGFRRRARYAPLKPRDLRIGCALLLRLAEPVPEGAAVEVTAEGGALWPDGMRFRASAARFRFSPVLHVSQAGYMPGDGKRAFVGYYLGSLGELELTPGTPFHLIDSRIGRTVYSGRLRSRREQGWTYAPAPYQQVMEADFSACRKPGEYRLWVPGLGVSLPFRIDPGVDACLARTYALGLYHQRCGGANALPFTRFTHAPCHTAPAEVPTLAFKEVQRQLEGETANWKDSPRHTAPRLKDVDSSLYPFIRQGRLDVSGGHHDAGDYSKYTLNSASLIHFLVFAADNFPGAADLDNLGLPESGDGRSDLLQLAKWEADYLAKLQDEDGGFYFLVYPRDRAYESDVLPDHGDPQVVFPKTTAATAAAVAALAQTASSPRFRRAFPQAAAHYLACARAGWSFLERAWARFGMDGSYQKITHYGDTFMHEDEIAWAAVELYLATGEARFHDQLRRRFDPSDPATLHWGWERLFASYGCAIRSYAFAARSGRVTEDRLDPAYLAKCRREIIAGANDLRNWSALNAYATSFPTESKRFRTAGWYFASAQAFDLAVAYQLDPRPEYMEALLGNLRYEAGCNPVNVTFITGLGRVRQREIVHHVAMNDRRVLPPDGLPLGSVTEGFMYLDAYRQTLGALSYPPDGAKEAPYPMYDRWGDSFNVATEFTIPIQGRALGVTCWLMARSALKTQPWRAATASITGLPSGNVTGRPFTVTLRAGGLDLKQALIVWEAAGQPPAFGSDCRVTPPPDGRGWIEAEALWPDGRRVFAVVEYGVRR